MNIALNPRRTRAGGAPPWPRPGRRGARRPSARARRGPARRTARRRGTPGAPARISGASARWFSSMPGASGRTNGHRNASRPRRFTAIRTRCAGACRRSRRARRGRAGVERGRRRDRRRARWTARVAHAARAAATCSGVSHPAPNARVICGANTCESPSTVPGRRRRSPRRRRASPRGVATAAASSTSWVANIDRAAVCRVGAEERGEPVLGVAGRARASARPGAAPVRAPAAVAATATRSRCPAERSRGCAGGRDPDPEIAASTSVCGPARSEPPRPQRDADLVRDRVGEQDRLGLLRAQGDVDAGARRPRPITRTLRPTAAWTARPARGAAWSCRRRCGP